MTSATTKKSLAKQKSSITITIDGVELFLVTLFNELCQQRHQCCDRCGIIRGIL